MLEIARERVPGAEIVEADLTRDDVLGDATFDLITAFRFFPNAQPDLRRDAMAALVRHLDRDGLLVFNNHENASSLLYRLSRLSGRGGRRGMARAEVDDLVAAAGLEIVGTRAIALLPLTERHPILPRPLLRAPGAPSFARLTVTAQPGRRLVHVLAYVPERRGASADMIEEPITIADLTVELRVDDRPPRRVYLAPGGAELPFVVAAGYVRVAVPRVDGYALVVFEE